MWRNGAAGPKTLCNACGVKYQRRMHKQKVAEDSAAAAAAAAAASAADPSGDDADDLGSRLNRKTSGVLRPAHEVGGAVGGPPLLARRSCTRTDGAAGYSDQPALVANDVMPPDPAGARRPATVDTKVRKARRLADPPARRSTSPQAASAATTFKADGGRGAAATPADASGPSSSAAALLGSSMTRLDGLQMQMAGRGGLPIIIPHVTVLLQPVTRAQALWTGNTSRTPSVALCVLPPQFVAASGTLFSCPHDHVCLSTVGQLSRLI